MTLNVKAFALTLGILWGAAIFLATMWLLVMGGRGNTIGMLGSFYIGYGFSFLGAFVGLAWGFAHGALSGGIFAWLYNKLAK